ncbi:TetR/AcrR family transcriptional regulator [Paenarthrobacter nitroguajacolicus]|uniref:TetR/AcrR family transcriptional regulator n=1 Tax=Paenarthrobacter nitroguajacolicus TaxID=211146 RepID=UPI00285A37CA|nr:TetR/AcrR family transcriptional regulator [Paenarthrobacter nitroguajacolicus]MDR6639497.1 AcrR family transcriptional regulator [Paenarthrobacter nitroguajacolicus]
MPRQVDPIERRRQITSAAINILATGGASALTLKSLAEELGGSITLVTHFFASREDIFTAVVDDLAESYDSELQALEAGADAAGRLKILLEWMVPLSPQDVDQESGRIALISQRHTHQGIDHFFEVMENRVRGLLSSHLEPVVPERDVPQLVDYLRALTNGLALSAVEHPEIWTKERVLGVIHRSIEALGLEETAAELQGAGAASPAL